ncbi:MAG: hypothetical protein J6I50_08655 [Clostridia bacterium]|nr:hypothetical protein [Clostridia bacterium]
MTNTTNDQQKNIDPKTMKPDRRSPDELLYSDLYKNAMMGADACAKMVEKAGNTQKESGMTACAELRQEIASMMETYASFAANASKALADMGIPAEQLTTLEKLPAEMGISMQTMFDKSASKCAELMINGVTMGIIDMKKAQRVCSEDGCSPAAYRMAGDMIAFCERHVERLKDFL